MNGCTESPWIGAGPDQRDLAGEVVEATRLEPRQGRHLRAGLDLEHADRIGGAEHVVDARRLLAGMVASS